MTIISAGDPRAAAAILAAAKAASARQKATVDAAVGQARGSARFAPSDTWKQMAKAKVQELIERVRILKKLYSGDPREMARMLAQVFKELKAAVKAYKDATGDELGMSGDVAAGALNAASAPPAGASGKTADPPADGSKDAGAADAPNDSMAAGGASAYAQVTQEVREGLGQDALEFAKSVRELARSLSDLLETARGQARAARPSKETDKALEDAGKALSDLRQGLEGLERDVREAVPTLGLRISVAA
ncbi:MAG: hypothetical protein JSR86_01865 [Proteobacteria bacterium]|nr:hypothetical protein [Pseudomonadota bacterium]